MDSFNVYGQTEKTIGGNTPIWLGTVKPIPVGGFLDIASGDYNRAGMAVKYNLSTKEITAYNSVADALVESANGYLYNDVVVGNEPAFNQGATGAVVMHHPEGLLIERVYPEITEEQIAQLQAKIPGVLLVRG